MFMWPLNQELIERGGAFRPLPIDILSHIYAAGNEKVWVFRLVTAYSSPPVTAWMHASRATGSKPNSSMQSCTFRGI
jgi:hypothetical protein